MYVCMNVCMNGWMNIILYYCVGLDRTGLQWFRRIFQWGWAGLETLLSSSINLHQSIFNQSSSTNLRQSIRLKQSAPIFVSQSSIDLRQPIFPQQIFINQSPSTNPCRPIFCLNHSAGRRNSAETSPTHFNSWCSNRPRNGRRSLFWPSERLQSGNVWLVIDVIYAEAGHILVVDRLTCENISDFQDFSMS